GARLKAAAPRAADGSLPGVGLANPVLYRQGKNQATGDRDFFDVTVGANGYFTALPRWDYVSGWGAPRLANLMTDVVGRTAPVNAMLPPPPAPPPAVDPGCVPTWTDDAGDDNAFTGEPGQEPELDLVEGDLDAGGGLVR